MEEFGATSESIPENAVPGVHSIIGKRGSGKSCLLRKVCLAAERLIIVDTLGEHCASGYVEYVATIAELIQRLDSPMFRVGYCPSPNGYDEVEYIERLSASRFQITLAIDEIDRWYPSPLSPLGDGIAAICNYGRHYGQGLVTTVRRPAAISRHLTAQGVLWVFPMRDDRDRNYVLKNTGVDGASIEVIETILLPNGRKGVVVTEVLRDEDGTQVLRFDLSTGELYESTTVYKPLPLPDDYQPEDAPAAEPPPEAPPLEIAPDETPPAPPETPPEGA